MMENTRLRRPLYLPPLGQAPLVSILVPCHNYERYVDRALSSALAQTYENLEIIVCDDGSTDGSCSVIEEHVRRDTRVVLVKKENGGPASALNAARARAAGEILCILDADDAFEARKLAVVVREMKSKGCGLLVHPMLLVDAHGRAIGRRPTIARFEEGWIADKVIARGGGWMRMPSSAVCLRSEVKLLEYPANVPNAHYGRLRAAAIKARHDPSYLVRRAARRLKHR